MTNEILPTRLQGSNRDSVPKSGFLHTQSRGGGGGTPYIWDDRDDRRIF